MTTPDHRLALPQGTRVQDFEFHRVLGHGGFGITYLGWNMALDIPVAIKEYLPADLAMREQDMSVLPKSSGDEADFHWGLDRFLDEARVMARFKHPNIVQVQHFFQAHGTAYIVMEYVEGETLSDLFKRRGTLTESELKNILLPLLAGLIEVHEAGILHRDIKPGNILLRAADGSPVLVDFGAARQAVGARSRSVTAVLTPGYAPIEQYSSRGHQGPWTDIYALGGVCYQALTGTVPDEAMDRIRQDPMIPITEAAKGKAAESFLSAIDWSLRVEEADRPQGVRGWRSALLGEEVIPEPVSTGTNVQTEQKPAPSKTHKTTTRWLLATGILLLIAAGTWWGMQEYQELFGQSTGDTSVVTDQGVPAVEASETHQGTETEAEITEETLAGEEVLRTPEIAEAEQPASKEPVLTPKEAEVSLLLAAARADLKARRLTSPAGNNAWDRFQRVLELEPTNPDAIKGMERVIESYMELFYVAVEQEDFDKATGYLTKIRELHPDSQVLEEGEQSLAGARQARSNRLAEEERQYQAEEAARQAELERQRIAEAIKEHWAAFEAAMQADDLNEAAGILVQIRDLNSEAPGLAAGEQRLSELERQLNEQMVQQQWVAFEAALEVEDLDAAADILSQVRDLNPEAQGLAENEQRLAEARQTVLEREYAGEMIDIPGGTFKMGDLSGEGDEDERPVHTVTVPDFRMGKYEVTIGQFRRFVEAAGYRTDAERNTDGNEGCYAYTVREGWNWTWGRSWRNPGYSVRDNQPVACVSWNDTQAFIAWLSEHTGESYRLPSEAEWEYAARAGRTTKYHFGDSESQLCRYGNHADSSTDFDWRNKSCSDGVDKGTAVVGHYEPNALGLYDMHGNVWEWVEDCYNYGYVGVPGNGRAWASGDCGRSMIRGGAWYSSLENLRSADRDWALRSRRNDFLGFRLAQDK